LPETGSESGVAPDSLPKEPDDGKAAPAPLAPAGQTMPETLLDTEGLEDILSGADVPATPEVALREDLAPAPAPPADPGKEDSVTRSDADGGENSASDPWQDNLSDADMGASSLGEVDLIELDALLDDMLSSAPASGPGPGNTSSLHSGAAPENASGGQTLSAPSASEDGGAPAAGEAAKLKALRGDLEDIKAGFSSLEERIKNLEDQFADLHSSLDKIAAATAARVIREELAALLAK
jgi:hypothetical protein